MHLTAFDTIIADLGPALHLVVEQSGKAADRLKYDRRFRGFDAAVHSVAWLVNMIVGEVRAVRERHASSSVGAYLEDAEYRGMVEEMLNMQAWAKHKVLCWLYTSESMPGMDGIAFAKRIGCGLCTFVISSALPAVATPMCTSKRCKWRRCDGERRSRC